MGGIYCENYDIAPLMEEIMGAMGISDSTRFYMYINNCKLINACYRVQSMAYIEIVPGKAGELMSYSTKEVTGKFNLSMHALRYYEKEGLLPPIKRDKNGSREYNEIDLEWLILIRCMRAAGMSIEYIRNYVELCKDGLLSTVSKRKDIILLQKKILEEQKVELDRNLKVINLKLKHYQELEEKQLDNPDAVIVHTCAFDEIEEIAKKKDGGYY
ncbi:MAG TPA: MerR family transcriptional regulator [Desulfosporosinus sp.]|nr:MerR family transcriptional regulator [Desulfosporosinus sp.]